MRSGEFCMRRPVCKNPSQSSTHDGRYWPSLVYPHGYRRSPHSQPVIRRFCPHKRTPDCRLSRPYIRYSFWPELWCRWSNASRALWRSFSIVATIGQNNTKRYMAWANLLQLESRKSNQKIITIIIWIDFASLLIIANFSSNLLLRSRIIDSS